MRYIIVPRRLKSLFRSRQRICDIDKGNIHIVCSRNSGGDQTWYLWASSDFLYFQAYIGVAIVYLIMTLTLSRLVAYIERRLAQSDRS